MQPGKKSMLLLLLRLLHFASQLQAAAARPCSERFCINQCNACVREPPADDDERMLEFGEFKRNVALLPPAFAILGRRNGCEECGGGGGGGGSNEACCCGSPSVTLLQ